MGLGCSGSEGSIPCHSSCVLLLPCLSLGIGAGTGLSLRGALMRTLESVLGASSPSCCPPSGFGLLWKGGALCTPESCECLECTPGCV